MGSDWLHYEVAGFYAGRVGCRPLENSVAAVSCEELEAFRVKEGLGGKGREMDGEGRTVTHLRKKRE